MATKLLIEQFVRCRKPKLYPKSR